MRNIKDFLLNLSDEDIDIKNKLDNMCGSEIDDELYETLTENKDMLHQLCDNVRYLVQEDFDDVADFVLEETRSLYEEGLIDSEDDYSAGLYNMDGLYSLAIEMLTEELEDEE